MAFDRRSPSARAQRHEPPIADGERDGTGRPSVDEVAEAPLAQARALVELYAEKGDPKYERAALKYLARYLAEGEPSLVDVAQMAALLAERGLIMRGL